MGKDKKLKGKQPKVDPKGKDPSRDKYVPSAAEIAAGAIEASDFEFIELLNTGANPLDLTGVRLSGAVQEFNFTNGDAAALTLPPGGRVIVCGKLSAFRARYGNGARVAGAFTGWLAVYFESFPVILLNIVSSAPSLLKSATNSRNDVHASSRCPGACAASAVSAAPAAAIASIGLA